MEPSAGHITFAGWTACSKSLSVIARPQATRQIIRHTQGRDYALPDPHFVPPSLSYPPDEFAIERELLPEKPTMSSFAPNSLPIDCQI
jgi:hypothetical protein